MTHWTITCVCSVQVSTYFWQLTICWSAAAWNKRAQHQWKRWVWGMFFQKEQREGDQIQARWGFSWHVRAERIRQHVKDTGSHVGSVCCLLGSFSVKLPGAKNRLQVCCAGSEAGADRGADNLQQPHNLVKATANTRDSAGSAGRFNCQSKGPKFVAAEKGVEILRSTQQDFLFQIYSL